MEVQMHQNPIVKEFFDSETWTFTYLVYDKRGGAGLVIDPVLNYDHKSGRTSTTSADQLITYVNENELQVVWILETHAHADHITAAPYLKQKLGGLTAIGKNICEVQKTFKSIFNLGDDFSVQGEQFDRLLHESEILEFGELTLEVLSVPGHTPACVAYKVGDSIFAGDTIFMPDVGTARCDFPGGNAETLYDSVQRLLNYPDDTKIFVCHDYPPITRDIQFQTNVGLQKSNNIHISEGISKKAFVEMRTARDKTLSMPVLILPSIQINVRAGQVPKAETNGVSYLKIPVNLL